VVLRIYFSIISVFSEGARAMATLRTATVDIKENGAMAKAYLAQLDDAAKHPGLILIQEWWGIEAHVIDLAQKLAVEGFVVVVPDLYDGKVATEPDDAGKAVMSVAGNLEKALKKVKGAIEYLQGLPEVEPRKVGIMGFCLGGLVTYKAAEAFAEIGAAVPFYGVMYDPTPEQVAQVNAPVLAMYAETDSYVPLEQIDKLRGLFSAAGKDYTAKVWLGTQHGFVNNMHPDLGWHDAASAAQAVPEAIAFLKQNLQ
jgi:carboxymethylenebutenolidase